ncbi:aminotransferase class I/II-fold pyridoxal phosphate-dependent enzyme [Nocardia puris]|uniref:DNA-binding transcriptional MocR family regulator n=2 Tax=Nocardia puris TaxID=208602 RepID=A0A366DAV4_9NOCA|nr:aminotransferase class I/II-fold pyridoxal phosphate-dependent enzyme [Nocardia puris]MBF6214057.1 aminotransferase class I/II-fold pyridoxal phosphate-dependent enzyme [Nocardia puris]MBF6368659.1 aminotransferase class I/II-fold pyridoxal phosphate-dependent enzyme [Nocardia puris]MBF6461561.1 aminotransferase class I/II-fold pyridoxal phosphate-dependent enzyme [Nocardia puris]RBO86564.1 DNA-binding transcriptional MocR family regulator [Nocardia puris]
MSDRIQIDDPTPAGIAGAIARLITSGELRAGDRLPTVRELSSRLGVSPATVSHGWRALAQAGLVVSRGRSGTFVAEGGARPAASRTDGMTRGATTARLDLSLGTPDPVLLPEIGSILSRLALGAETTDYHQAPVVPELGRLLQADWPTGSGALTVVDGAMDAVARSLHAVVRFGDRVIVEDPTFPYILDYLDSIGAQTVPVRMDGEGVLPAEFARALATGATAAVLQPRAQNPTGASMSAERAAELVEVLRRSEHRCMVIEDDHSGPVVPAEDISLGRWVPDRVLHVRSYSKSHGPDLRIAALSGPEEIIDRIVATRMLGPGWTPRILQRLLHEMLRDETVTRTVEFARDQYQARRRALADGLRERGVRIADGQGLNAWVPVADERTALVHLAANGIRVAPGGPFFVADRGHPEAVRVTIAPLSEGVEEVASVLALAARPRQSEYFSLGREG